MKSTTGLPMALAIFLLVSNLIQSLPLTASTSMSGNSPPCKPELMELINATLNSSFDRYKEANGNITNSWSKHVLRIPNGTLPEEQKRKAAICGMELMLEAITFILNNHTSDKISTDHELRHQLNTIIKYLGPNNLQSCMHSFLGREQCPTHKLEEPNSFYKKKLWGCRVFQDSLKFIKWLKNFLHSPRHL